MPGLAVRGTFSPARAWRPAAVARLAQTLGITKTLPKSARAKPIRIATGHRSQQPTRRFWAHPP